MITPEQLAKPNTEHAHQAALFCWAANYLRQPSNLIVRNALQNLFAIPNGDQRGDGTKRGAQIAGGRLKAEGQKNGVPDVMLAWPIIGDNGPHLFYAGLFIEMKRPALKDRPLSYACIKDQLDCHERLRVAGYRVVVCYSWIEARDEILKYLGVA